jgi:predicted methyltransferase
VDVATDRPGWDKETHRLNEQVVIDEFTAHGFALEGSSDMLRNPNDDHSIMGFDEGRHTMDRYLLKFRKVVK